MTDWWTTLAGLHDRAWQILSNGLSDRTSAARQPTLATTSPDGWPESRTVVLRHVDQTHRKLEIYTDSRSDKIQSFRHSPRAALHVWDAAHSLQIRLQSHVTLVQGDDTATRWHALSNTERLSYGVMPFPGETVPNALGYHKTPDQSRFCVILLTVSKVDIVYLGAKHRRAVFDQVSDWAGQWCVP